MYLTTLVSFETKDEAVKAAEAIFTATRGMFVALEGEVWISSMPGEYQVWIIKEGTYYLPSQEEVKDACNFENISLLIILDQEEVNNIKLLTINEFITWTRY